LNATRAQPGVVEILTKGRWKPFIAKHRAAKPRTKRSYGTDAAAVSQRLKAIAGDNRKYGHSSGAVAARLKQIESQGR
jgi:hypothetical protein